MHALVDEHVLPHLGSSEYNIMCLLHIKFHRLRGVFFARSVVKIQHRQYMFALCSFTTQLFSIESCFMTREKLEDKGA